MDENVIILGAGASEDSGAPLMHNFLDKAEDLLSTNINKEVKASIVRVFKLLDEMQKIHAKTKMDLNNIEVLFGAIEMAQIINRLGDIDPTSIPSLRNDIIRLIICTIENCMNFTFKDYNIVPPTGYNNLMSYLVEHSLFKNTSIITFNYDIGIDTAISSHGLKVDYGFGEHVINHNYVNLFKLHG